jgi:hypothetical protein
MLRAEKITYFKAPENLGGKRGESNKISKLMEDKTLDDATKLMILKEHFESPDSARIKAVEALLDHQDSYGMTFFHEAASRGHRACVAYLLEKYPRLYEQTSQTGLLALHYAASHPELFNYLCSERFERMHLKHINHTCLARPGSSLGHTLLENAISKGRPDLKTIENLLRNGARLYRGGPFLWHRGEHGDWEATLSIVALLVQYGVNPNPGDCALPEEFIHRTPEVTAILEKYHLNLDEKGQPIVATSSVRGSTASTLTLPLAATGSARSWSDSSGESEPASNGPT